MAEARSQRRAVLGDWGTSRLRLYLDDGGEIAATSEGPGIGTLASAGVAARAAALGALLDRWLAAGTSIDVFLCGMAGSPAGLFEVPYASLPADLARWRRTARTMRVRECDVTIAAGLSTAGLDVPPDVMRGEETQAFGALALDPALADGSHLFLLPGTHSKWMQMTDGIVTRFRTAMTGELYALLSERSTLLKAGGETAARDDEADRKAGMASGVERARSLEGGLTSVLFEARAARLLDGRTVSWAAGFLSGLLIGYEVSSMTRHFETAGRIHVIGDPRLVSLYRFVLQLRGDRAVTLDGAACAVAGLRLLGGLWERRPADGR